MPFHFAQNHTNAVVSFDSRIKNVHAESHLVIRWGCPRVFPPQIPPRQKLSCCSWQIEFYNNEVESVKIRSSFGINYIIPKPYALLPHNHQNFFYFHLGVVSPAWSYKAAILIPKNWMEDCLLILFAITLLLEWSTFCPQTMLTLLPVIICCYHRC